MTNYPEVLNKIILKNYVGHKMTNFHVNKMVKMHGAGVCPFHVTLLFSLYCLKLKSASIFRLGYKI